MATYTGLPGQNNSFPGTAGADTFNFAVADLTSGDTLTGGAGLDTLALSGAGLLTAANLSGVSGIDILTFVNGGISVQWSEAVALANGALTVNGSAGNDSFDASAVTTASRTIAVTAGAGSDVFRGGAGNDVFRFNAADLTSGDTVAGGGGTVDQLFIDSAGTVIAAALAGVTQIERVLLANGTNSLFLTAAMGTSASGNLIQIFGNAGADTINASALAGGVSRVDISSGAGLDTLTGSAGNDVFRFAGADLAGDSVRGGAGNDVVVVTTADTLTVADLAGMTGIDQVTFNVAGSSITLDNLIAAANGGLFSVFGSAGNDAVDASAVTLTTALLVQAGAGNDTLRGGVGNDLFRFNADDLDSGDIVAGGGGAGLDTINFLAAGTVSAADLANVSGIERLTFAVGANSVTLTQALLNSAGGGLLTIFGNSGNDIVDASAITNASHRIDVYANAGIDMLTGGAGNDVFRFAASLLDGSDVVAGGAGYDELRLTSNGAITAAKLAGVTGIDQITFTIATTSLTLNDAVAAANAATLAVFGSSGNDQVNASAVTLAGRAVSVTALAGSDTLLGGAGADSFRFNADDLDAGDTVTGGGGGSADTLVFQAGGTVSAADLASVSGIEQISTAAGAATSIALTNAMVGSANNGLVTIFGNSGNETIDASGVTTASNRILVHANSGNDSLTGGAGNDEFRFAATALNASDTVVGGAGSDTLTFNGAGAVALGGTFSGLETVAFGIGGVTATSSNAFATANAAVLAVTGSSGNDGFDASGVTLTNRAIAVTAGAGADTFRGGSGADSFGFTAADLTAADTVAGGTGASIDTLAFSTAGTIASASLAGVSAIEAITLANGTNSLSLTAALVGSAASTTVTVAGGTGNDTLNTSLVTTSAHRVEFSAGSGNDSFTGGTGTDILKIAAADMTAADSFAGGAGASFVLDTIQFTTTGAVGSVAGVTGVERLLLASGGNSVAIGDAMVGSAYSATLLVFGGAGNDVVNASAVTTATNILDITSGAGNDTLTGGAGDDIFRFAPAALTGSDIVNGGAGFDRISFDGAGTIAAAQLAGTSNLELIVLGNPGSSISFNNAALANNAATLQINGALGNDVVDASAVTNAARAINVLAQNGDDTLRGGAGADIFRFNNGDLRAADLVSGGAGSAIDQLVFLTAGTMTSADMAQVSGIERVQLANGTNILSVDDALVGTANAATLQIFGGTGDDTINGGAVANAANKLDITAGTGNDVLIGGAGADVFRFAITALDGGDSVDGGAGPAIDTLAITGAGTLDLAGSNVAQIEAVTLDNNTHTLILGNSLVSSAEAQTVTVTGGTGADTIDVSRVDQSGYSVIVNTGDGNDVLIDSAVGAGGGPSASGLTGSLGLGNDLLKGLSNYFDVSGALSGGAGTDTIELENYYGWGTTLGAGVTEFEIVNLVDTITGGGYSVFFAANDTAGLAVNGQFAGNYYQITLGAGGQTANGNALADTLTGGSGNDTLNGFGDSDVLDGGAGSDTLNAGEGDDYVVLDGLDLVVAGGNGSDTLRAYSGGVINLSLADQTVGDTANTTGFEHVDGDIFGSTALTITGSSGANGLTGGYGNDTIDGNGGADIIQGGYGSDTISYRGTELTLAGTFEFYGVYDPYTFPDTLVMRAAATVNLTLADQTTGDATNVVGFTNVDASALAVSISITGDAYNNRLIGGSAIDSINGGDGDDWLDGGAGADTVVAGNGSDTVTHRANAASISGGADIDTLRVVAAATINLNAGDQSSGDLATTLGFENVDASGSAAAVTMTGRFDHQSILRGGSAGDTITGGAAGAFIYGNGGADIITGGAAANYIWGGAGADTMTGGAGQDNFYLLSGDFVAGESINGGGDYDYVSAQTSVDFTTGSLNNVEFLYAFATDADGNYLDQDVTVTLTGAQAVQIQQIWANGYLHGLTAEAFVINVAAGTTVDLSTIGWVNMEALDSVAVNGAGGNETIRGAGIAHTLHGNAGNDTLLAPVGYWIDGTHVFGDAGNDRIDYGYGNFSALEGVWLDGGADSDTLVHNYADGNPLVIDLSAGTDQTQSDGVIVTNFENVDWSGSYWGLFATGSGGANTIIGSQGTDTIDGLGGADALDGQDGDDTIRYRSDAASIAGGGGTDWLVVAGAATINLASVDQAPLDGVILSGFENIDGRTSAGALTLRGRDDVESTLLGGSAADSITAGDASANINGGAGADTLIGGIGNDDFGVFAGDIVAGESISGGDGYDSLAVFATMDISAAAISGIEKLDAFSHDGTDYTNFHVAVTMTGAQAASFSEVRANGALFDLTTETFTVNVASGTTADLGSIYWYNFDSTDSLAINGAGGNETITGANIAHVLHGNAGNDVLLAPSGYWVDDTQVFGDAGNDRVDLGYYYSTATLNGGADSDTLVYSYADGVYWTINLAAADQTTDDNMTVSNFENVDLTTSFWGANVTGNASANILIGTAAADVLSGAGGADTLDGGLGDSDTLTGGAAADTFRWTTRDYFEDVVTDFLAADDTLAFASSAFDINGTLNSRIAAASTATSITGADIVVYTGAVFDSANDVYTYLDAAAGGSVNEGIFVVGANSGGQTVVYHAVDASFTNSTDIAAVANLGTLTAPGSIQLADFVMV